MAFFDFLKKKEKPVKTAEFAPTYNSTLPFYTSFGDSIYKSDIVVQSIRCKANEFRKLEPRHIRADGKTHMYFAAWDDNSLDEALEYNKGLFKHLDSLQNAGMIKNYSPLTQLLFVVDLDHRIFLLYRMPMNAGISGYSFLSSSTFSAGIISPSRLPQRGHRVLPPAQVVPQLEHWLSRVGRTGFTGPQA